MAQNNERFPIVWLATLGPIGRLPGPGTWGSAVGLLIGIAGIDAWETPGLLLALVVTFPLCALICSAAEQHLGRHDPPVVILDEVWAMAAIIIVQARVIGVSGRFLLWAFLLFRAFDIMKPPPLKQLARLPAGWGIIADDLGAAVYSCLVLWIIHRSTHFGF